MSLNQGPEKLEQKGETGHIHPLTHIIRHTVSIFDKLGFSVVHGPHIENEYYNFDALNIPEHHPARDMWDTFWLKPENSKRLLRTHTSPVQVRYAEKNDPPIRIIVPGKTFRHEATDSTHETQFYQLEGLYIDKNVSLANLKHTLEYYLENLFKAEISVRLRPSYFPFVEPGVEVDMTCFKCQGLAKECSACKKTGWIEIMGAGMVHPKVMQNMGINPRKFSGFAFGVGIDRLVMLKYGIEDIRSLYHPDLRLINQF